MLYSAREENVVVPETRVQNLIFFNSIYLFGHSYITVGFVCSELSFKWKWCKNINPQYEFTSILSSWLCWYVRVFLRSASQPPNNIVFSAMLLYTYEKSPMVWFSTSQIPTIATTLRHPTTKHLIYDLFVSLFLLLLCCEINSFVGGFVSIIPWNFQGISLHSIWFVLATCSALFICSHRYICVRKCSLTLKHSAK